MTNRLQSLAGVIFLLASPAISDSQNGPKWGMSGNQTSATDFLGSTNPADLIFKTNDKDGMRLQLGGNVGIGTKKPSEKLEVDGNIKTNGDLVVNSIFLNGHIKSQNNEVHFGDSSVVVNPTYNNVYNSGVSDNLLYYGLGIGSFSARGKGLASVAIGYVSQTDADYSFCLGTYLNTSVSNNGCIVIGRGITNIQPLAGNKANSLFVGFNSDIPTLYVGPSAGAGFTGNVGIGTTNVPAKLTIDATQAQGINCKTKQTSPYGYNILAIADGTTLTNANLTKTLCVRNAVSNREDFIVYGDGKTAIGTPASLPAGYKLYVTGGILTERCKVAISGSIDWADHVFNPGYELMPIVALKTYLRENRHLPGVPNACEVNENGYDVTAMFAALLEKIEENTLYIIQLENENTSLKLEVEQIKKEIK